MAPQVRTAARGRILTCAAPLCLLTIATPSAAVPVPAARQCIRLPANFRDGRVFVGYRAAAGASLLLFTDTGGGGSMLTVEAAKRLGVATDAPSAELSGELGPHASIAPIVPASDGSVPSMPGPAVVRPSAFPLRDWPEAADGSLGQDWFAGRSWTWDFGDGSLSTGCAGKGREVAVGLPPAAGSGRTKQFPRIEVTIAGEEISVLLDTGATTWLEAPALASIGDGGPSVRSTSMMASSRVALWHGRHPEWRIIERAQKGTGARMIEVPDVVVGGFQVGPVWFTERPDANFKGMMSSMMVAPVEGALGANALRSLRVTVDYVARRAWVARSTDVRGIHGSLGQDAADHAGPGGEG